MTEPAMNVVSQLADLVDEHYVLAALAPTYADRIRTHAPQLAAALPDVSAVNAALHQLVPDRHLGLRSAEPGATRPNVEPSNAGLHRVEHLDGGVCVVEIHPFFTGPLSFLPSLRAAAQQAAESQAVVLDLRHCHGGDTDSASLMHGWLLGPEPVHLGRFEQRGRPSTDYVSDPAVGIHFAGPVRVLTSARTFSGGEDLAYVLQTLGRARVIGETTAGGAHPVEHFDLPGGHLCQIPVARSVIDATGSNWEGVGVVPDEACSAGEALERALDDIGGRKTHGE